MDWFTDFPITPSSITMTPNKYKIPCAIIPCNPDGAARFNRILKSLYESEYSQITRTPSGGISFERGKYRPPCYDVRRCSACIEATVIDADGMIRVQLRSGFGKETPEEEKITGNQSWKLFIGFCNKHDVHIYDLALPSKEEGYAIKQQIQRPIIGLERATFRDLTFERCHHLDLNSSHPSGMAEAFPVLRPVIQDIYEHRKESKRNKALLTHVWGYMQSPGVQYRFSHISKAGMDYTCRRVRELRQRLIDERRVPILYNTDGIWYYGDVYHAEDEGYDLGMWKNDRINCKFRAISNGCYEYQEDNGVYHPVLRSTCALDKVKPRDQWVWGDIKREEASSYLFYWGGGYVLNKPLDEGGKPYGENIL